MKKTILAAVVAAFALTACGDSEPLSQSEYVAEVKALGFTVQDPAKAYGFAKLQCQSKHDDPNFADNVESLVRLATIDDPEPEGAYTEYVKVVERTCA